MMMEKDPGRSVCPAVSALLGMTSLVKANLPKLPKRVSLLHSQGSEIPLLCSVYLTFNQCSSLGLMLVSDEYPRAILTSSEH